MRTEMQYICEVCKKSFSKEGDCLKHELECKEEEEQYNYYNHRLKKLPNQQYIFHAVSGEDLEKLSDVVFNSYIYPGDTTFPCTILISEYETTCYWDNVTETNYSVQTLDSYVSRLEELRSEAMDATYTK